MSSLKTLAKTIRQTPWVSALFLLFFLVLFAGSASAQAPYFYQSENLEIRLPADIEFSPCSAALTLKSGIACLRLGKDGQDGVAFLTLTKGYTIHGREALEKHLLASEASLQDIPNITVMQSLILSDAPLIGLLEILREDDAVLEVTELSKPPLRQSSFLIPLDSELAQIFVYLSTSDVGAPDLHAKLLAGIPLGIRATQKLMPATTAGQSEGSIAQKGSLSALPVALVIGGLLALLVIAALSVTHFRHQRKREREGAALTIPNEGLDANLDQEAPNKTEEASQTQDSSPDSLSQADASAEDKR